MVESSPGERLSLPPHLPHTPASSAAATQTVAHVDLWCSDNSLATFWAATATDPAPELSFDLRSPLGITPAALLAMGAAEQVAAGPASRPGSGEGQRQHLQLAQQVQQPPRQQHQQQKPAAAPSLRRQQDPADLFRSFTSSRRELRIDTAARLITPSGELNNAKTSSLTHLVSISL